METIGMLTRALLVSSVEFLTLSSFVCGSEVYYDSLCITDGRTYHNARGAYCGGRRVFGSNYDVQIADDFTISNPVFITSITADYVSHLGVCPADICIAVFASTLDECAPYPMSYYYLELQSEAIACETFDDVLFGLSGLRISVTPEPLWLPDGHWFVCVQPRSDDWGYELVEWFASCVDDYYCPAVRRDGGELNVCCDGEGAYGSTEWVELDPDSGELGVTPMRLGGIGAGDCSGGEQVSARCRPRGGGGGFNIVVKVRDGQADGAVTALLDPPDPQSMSIALDGEGRGKGKFKRVAAGEHRVFVCDAIVDVTCAP